MQKNNTYWEEGKWGWQGLKARKDEKMSSLFGQTKGTRLSGGDQQHWAVSARSGPRRWSPQVWRMPGRNSLGTKDWQLKHAWSKDKMCRWVSVPLTPGVQLTRKAANPGHWVKAAQWNGRWHRPCHSWSSDCRQSITIVLGNTQHRGGEQMNNWNNPLVLTSVSLKSEEIHERAGWSDSSQLQWSAFSPEVFRYEEGLGEPKRETKQNKTTHL